MIKMPWPSFKTSDIFLEMLRLSILCAVAMGMNPHRDSSTSREEVHRREDVSLGKPPAPRRLNGTNTNFPRSQSDGDKAQLNRSSSDAETRSKLMRRPPKPRKARKAEDPVDKERKLQRCLDELKPFDTKEFQLEQSWFVPNGFSFDDKSSPHGLLDFMANIQKCYADTVFDYQSVFDALKANSLENKRLIRQVVATAIPQLVESRILLTENDIDEARAKFESISFDSSHIGKLVDQVTVDWFRLIIASPASTVDQRETFIKTFKKDPSDFLRTITDEYELIKSFFDALDNLADSLDSSTEDDQDYETLLSVFRKFGRLLDLISVKYVKEADSLSRVSSAISKFSRDEEVMKLTEVNSRFHAAMMNWTSKLRRARE